MYKITDNKCQKVQSERVMTNNMKKLKVMYPKEGSMTGYNH